MARWPNVESAIVEEAKLTRYLLDANHADGGPKAKFLSIFGFSSAEPAILEAALLRHVVSHDVREQRKTAFGVIIEVVGPLETPDG